MHERVLDEFQCRRVAVSVLVPLDPDIGEVLSAIVIISLCHVGSDGIEIEIVDDRLAIHRL